MPWPWYRRRSSQRPGEHATRGQLNDTRIQIPKGVDPKDGDPAAIGTVHQGLIPTLWSMFLTRAVKIDNDKVDSWREDMDSLLLFAAIFAASVTAFVIESYKKLQPDPADITAIWLSRISGQLSQTNETLLPSIPSTFHPSPAAVFYNLCWFASLILSLTCALGAILVRQWVLNYLQNAHNEIQPHDRARMRHYLFEGIDTWKFAAFIEFLPFLLHLSLLLFMAGLIAFISEVNRAVLIVTVILFTFGLILYAVLTLLPLTHPECPYQTPLSSWCLVAYSTGVSLWNAIRRPPVAVPLPLAIRDRRRAVLNPSGHRHELDKKIVKWLRSLLTEDREIVLLMNAISEFIRSFPQTPHSDDTPLDIVRETMGDQISEMVHSSLAPRSPPIDWTLSFPPSLHIWHTLHELSRKSFEEQNPNFDLTIRANSFMTLVINRQLERSRSDPSVGDSIANLRRKLLEQWHERFYKKALPDFSELDNQLEEDTSHLWRSCWLMEFSCRYPCSVTDHPPTVNQAQRHTDTLIGFKIKETGIPERVSQWRAFPISKFGSRRSPRDFTILSKATLVALPRTLEVDFLILLLCTLSQSWLHTHTLSETQLHLILQSLAPVAQNARIYFTDRGRLHTTQLQWFFRELSKVTHSSGMRLANILAPVCAAVLFPDGDERRTFKDLLYGKLSTPSNFGSPNAFLDVVYECIQDHLAIDSQPASRIFVVCNALGMARQEKDRHAILRRVREGSTQDLDALFGDFTKLYLSCIFADGELRDLLHVLKYFTRSSTGSNSFELASSSMAFANSLPQFRLLFRFLDSEDVLFVWEILNLDHIPTHSSGLEVRLLLLKVIRDVLPSRPARSLSLLFLDNSDPNHKERPIPTKRIGSKRVLKRRASLSSLPLGLHRSYVDNSPPRKRSRSIPRSWKDVKLHSSETLSHIPHRLRRRVSISSLSTDLPMLLQHTDSHRTRLRTNSAQILSQPRVRSHSLPPSWDASDEQSRARFRSTLRQEASNTPS